MNLRFHFKSHLLCILTLFTATSITIKTVAQNYLPKKINTVKTITHGAIGGTFIGTANPLLITPGAIISLYPLFNTLTTKKNYHYKKILQALKEESFLLSYGALYGICIGGLLFGSNDHTQLTIVMTGASALLLLIINAYFIKKVQEMNQILRQIQEMND